MVRVNTQKNYNPPTPGETSFDVSLHALTCSTLEDSETYLEGLRLEDKYISSPSSWMLAQTFKENRDAALSVRNRLVKELTVYKPFLRQHPFNKYFMMVDPRSQRVNEIDKFLNFTKEVSINSNKITQDDIERAKLVPIQSLYSFKQRGKKIFCPFHDDIKNPSASIKDNNFHCFTCNVHYDSIEFIKQLNGLSFVDAVGRLK